MNTRMKKLQRAILACLLFALYSSGSVLASITATPKFLFLDGTKKSTPIQIANVGAEEREVWIEVKFGYVVSDDSGKISLFMDSLDTEGLSAVPWIQIFPQRFVLAAGENQTIRLTASVPASVKEGEYWARVLVTSKPRKPPASSKPNQTQPNSGLVLRTQLGLPFHYRAGRVLTGVQIADFNSSIEGSDLNVKFRLIRTGNASYWGTRTLRIIDQTGKILYTRSKNAAVYKSLNVLEPLTLSEMPRGSYKIELELATGKRTDIRKDDLLPSPVVRSSIPLVIE